MKPRVTIATATSPDGTELQLVEHDGDYVINADGIPLMSTRLHFSEEELARLVCEHLPRRACVLIGGLGCGYTLRTALSHLTEDGKAVQAELVPEVVEWNRGPLAGFADHPLDDPRVELVIDDVANVLKSRPRTFDAIMLDVDNGPSAIIDEKNAWLYSDAGLYTIRQALKADGRLAIWAAVDDDRAFPARLRNHGFEDEKHLIRPRKGKGGFRHVIYVGRLR
ncbi:MAG: hypothetical protein CMJ83_10080 [Planctomycetes bacterium]|nr:hypothetical protein [Planctomycetota bacterium]